MPGSTISSFGEPDDYQAALRRQGGFDLLVTGQGEFGAQLAQISLARVDLVAGQENLARIAFIDVAPSRVRVLLPTRGDVSMVCDGIPVRAGEIVTHGPGQRLHEWTDGPCRWRAIWLRSNDLARYGTAMAGAGFNVPGGACRWRPSPQALGSLKGLYDDVLRAAKTQPSVTARARAAHGLEQQVIEAVVECLLLKPIDERASASVRRTAIMNHFEDLLLASPDRALSLGEISGMLGVPGRTLRACCQLHLGMSPQRYLRLRQMQSARRALRDLDPGTGRVSDVARRYGFGGLGRFAAAYRRQFGELPSTTLQHKSGG